MIGDNQINPIGSGLSQTDGTRAPAPSGETKASNTTKSSKHIDHMTSVAAKPEPSAAAALRSSEATRMPRFTSLKASVVALAAQLSASIQFVAMWVGCKLNLVSQEKYDFFIIDQEKSSLVTRLIRGGTLADVDTAASRIATLHGKPKHAEEASHMAKLLIEDEKDLELVTLAAKWIVIGEHLNPAAVMLRKGKMSSEETEKYITPISSNAVAVLRQVKGAEGVAQILEGTSRLTTHYRTVYQIAALAAPRFYRTDFPNGFPPKEIGEKLAGNPKYPGYDAGAEKEVFERYVALKTKENSP